MTNGGRKCLHVVGTDLLELLDVTAVQVRRTTTRCALGNRAFDAVLFVDLHEVLADSRLLVFNETRRKDGDLALTLGDDGLHALLEPSREANLCERREKALARDARRLFDDLAYGGSGLGAHRLVHDGRDCCGNFAERIGVAHHRGGEALANGNLLGGLTHRVGAQHEARKIERPFVLSGNVGTVDVAELALEAFVDDLVLLGDRELARILIVVLVDKLEEGWKRRAVLEAQATPVAQVVNTRQFLAYVGLVEILRMFRVVGDRHRCRLLGDVFLQFT